jgi:Xaa-Pro aminopeptidase
MAMMVNWIQDARHTQAPEVEIAGILSDHGYSKGTVGMAGLADITTYALMSGLGKLAPGATLVDATDLFDDVRVKKSPEEMENHRETSRILEQVFRSLEAHIRPGALEIDVMAEAHRLVRQYGCLTGIAQTGRTSPRALIDGRHAPFERGEYLSIDLEWQGPSGYWLELRRNYCFGKPSDEARRFWDIRCEVFQACIDAMKSGHSSDDVLAARDRVNDKYGFGGRELVSYSAHGLGTDSLEPPWSPGKERIMETDMVINLHPHSTFSDPAAYQSVSALSLADNIRVTPTGGERLTEWTDELVDLDA